MSGGVACSLPLELGGDKKGVPLPAQGLRGAGEVPSQGWVPGVDGGPTGPRLGGGGGYGAGSRPWPVRGLLLQRCGVTAPETGTLWPRGCLLGSGMGWGAWEARRGSLASLWFGRHCGKPGLVMPEPEKYENPW